MKSIIEARGLTKQFNGHAAVRGIDLDVPAGRCFGVLGPNGAGKTTTLRMVLGVSPPTSGELNVFGLPIASGGRAIRARMGVVPQLDNLDPDFTVVENLRIFGRYFGIDPVTLDARIRELLAFVNLADRVDSPIATLSGGMKRRLTIARALINEPELVVLDEPTTGLDPQARHMIWAKLRELRAAGKTLLLTTHYMEEAERLCDELVIMDHGKILAQGSPQTLVRTHVEPEVIEVRGDDARARDLLTTARDGRAETVGDTCYFYTRDARAVVGLLEKTPELTFLHRPANLEDVFLRLTGRDLRD
jgi:lipooligosaccharide transport system ATP-binding protein